VYRYTVYCGIESYIYIFFFIFVFSIEPAVIFHSWYASHLSSCSFLGTFVCTIILPSLLFFHKTFFFFYIKHPHLKMSASFLEFFDCNAYNEHVSAVSNDQFSPTVRIVIISSGSNRENGVPRKLFNPLRGGPKLLSKLLHNAD